MSHLDNAAAHADAVADSWPASSAGLGKTWFASLGGVLSLGLLCLAGLIGFLHEDAYILFTYSRNLAEAGQIAFDAFHGPAEGATDFLWMALIAGQVWLGVDPGLAAALLNALGAGLLLAAMQRVHAPGSWRAACVRLLPLVLISPMMGAALGGFSVLFYTGVYAQMLMALLRRRVHAAIVLGTLLCLIRPDAVILAAGALLPAIHRFRYDRRMWRLLALAALVGGGYFAWRVRYFGEWLPLPLLIKSQGDSLRESLWLNGVVLLPFVHLPYLYWRFGSRLSRFDLGGLLLPAALLWLALCLAHQSQNISHRFQAPIMVSLLLVLLSLRLPTRGWFLVAVAPFLLFGLKNLAAEGRYLVKPSYINTLPGALSHLPAMRPDLPIALTEAGRLPHYLPVRYLDLVGLNSRDVAVGGLTVEKLRAFGPALIFLHHDGTYVQPESSASHVRMGREAFLERHFRTNDSRDPVRRAPSVAGQYIQQTPELDMVFFVRYGKGFFHVFVLDSRRVPPDAFEQVLERSMQDRGLSHCQVSVHWPCRLMH